MPRIPYTCVCGASPFSLSSTQQCTLGIVMTDDGSSSYTHYTRTTHEYISHYFRYFHIPNRRKLCNLRVVALVRASLRKVVEMFREGVARKSSIITEGYARLLAITFGQGYDRLRACPDYPSRHVLVALNTNAYTYSQLVQRSNSSGFDYVSRRLFST